MLLYSPAYVILVALFLSLLSVQVELLAWKSRAPRGGAGSDDALSRARKAHQRMLEYSVVFIPLLICAELMGVSNRWIAIISVVFLVGRVAHTSGIMTETPFHWAREGGAVLSHGASAALMIKLATILYSIPS